MSAVEQLSKWVLGGVSKSAAETSHPVDKVDNGTKPATTGERSSENAKDVTAQTPGQSAPVAPVASDKPSTGGTSGTPANEGTGAGMTGDRPAEGTKPNADDPGTSHPAKTAGFASLQETKEAGLSILAALAAAKPAVKEAAAPAPKDEKGAKSAAAAPAAPAADAPAPEADAAKEETAKEAGAKAADTVIEALGLGKEAKDASAAVIGDVLKSAAFDAANVAEYLFAFSKSAAAMPAEMPPEMAGGMPPGAEGGMPPGALADTGAAGAPDGDQISPEELMQLLDEAGVSPEELLQELVASGEIPPEVAQQIMQEAMAAEQAAGGAPAEAGAPPAAPAAPAEQTPPPPPEESSKSEGGDDAEKQTASKSAAEAEAAAAAPAGTVDDRPATKAKIAPNTSEAKAVMQGEAGDSKKEAAFAAILKAAAKFAK